jgi:IMP dehydrogenase
VYEALQKMASEGIRALVVLDSGKLAGVVSVGDVVKAIIEDQRFTIEQLEHYITNGR